jgi:hypothetical protein
MFRILSKSSDRIDEGHRLKKVFKGEVFGENVSYPMGDVPSRKLSENIIYLSVSQ